MRYEDAVSEHKRRKDELGWDDIKKRRVLARVMETRRADRRGTSRGLILASAVAATTVLMAVGWVLIGQGEDAGATVKAHRGGPGVVATVNNSSLVLADGSRVTMLAAAKVAVSSQSSRRVRIVQSRGEARYEVTKNAKRQFVVEAAGVIITVKGTVFTVKVTADEVVVSVEEGRVEVARQGRVSTLGEGDELAVGTKASSKDSVENAEPQTDPRLDEEQQEGHQNDSLSKNPAARAQMFDKMIGDADDARRSGDLNKAAGLLRKLVKAHSGDRRVVSVMFTLGKIERKRGNFAEAALSFRRCWKRAPGGTLAEDARAQEAKAWMDGGRVPEAKAAANRYLDRHSDGPYVEIMNTIIR